MTAATKTETALPPLTKRHTCLGVIEVNFANPNGDPDFEARPRTVNQDDRGWISAVSLKKKVRQLWEDPESPAFEELVAELGLDPDRMRILESVRRGSPHADPVAAINWVYDMINGQNGIDAFLNSFYDVRAFGTTFLQKKEKKPKGKKAKDAEEGEEAEDGNVKFKRTGPVTFTDAVSVAPVAIIEATHTKTAPTDEKKLAAGNGDIAPLGKRVVLHGLYVFRIEVNPNVARHTRTTEQDVEVLRKTLRHVFTTSASCSRPGGSVVFRHLWWAKHSNALGSFNANEFCRLLTPTKRSDQYEPSKSIHDYDIPTPESAGLTGINVEDLAA